jgi:hypothetical protein
MADGVEGRVCARARLGCSELCAAQGQLGGVAVRGATSAVAHATVLFVVMAVDRQTTIRYMGGLLAAYELSHDTMFLEKTQEVRDCAGVLVRVC